MAEGAEKIADQPTDRPTPSLRAFPASRSTNQPINRHPPSIIQSLNCTKKIEHRKGQS